MAISVQSPPEGTVERWAWDYVTTAELDHKLSPPPVPERWEASPVPRRVRPGRPDVLTVLSRSPKTPRAGAFAGERARARMLATFLHHELQAAELLAWAVLAFPDTPRAFRRGLLAIAREEVRHMNLYRERLTAHGALVGDEPVRDWFWERVPTCSTALQFVALLGIGLEGANLEHAADFAERFRAGGDEPTAHVLELVGREEEAHVRFAARWFREWTGGVDFERWCAELPAPLTPLLFRGRSLNRAARRRAGLDEGFVEALAAWPDASPGS